MFVRLVLSPIHTLLLGQMRLWAVPLQSAPRPLQCKKTQLIRNQRLRVV